MNATVAQNSFPLVSIITLNYNGANETLAFLESTVGLTYPNYEILVCDMDSTLDPASLIDFSKYPTARLLKAGKNLGFAAGNNWGMRQASGAYFLVINNDTVVEPGLIEILLHPFSIDKKIAFVSPKIKFFANPNIIQYAGFTKMNMYTGRTVMRGCNEEDIGQYNEPGYTFGAHGCAMMIKKQVAEQIGMFPERFFLYYEEWDWSLRALRHGFNIYYQPAAVVYHKESMSVGKKSVLQTYYISRNRILCIRRNASAFQLAVFSVFYTFIALPKSILQFLLQGQFNLLRSYFSALFWNIVHSKNSRV